MAASPQVMIAAITIQLHGMRLIKRRAEKRLVTIKQKQRVLLDQVKEQPVQEQHVQEQPVQEQPVQVWYSHAWPRDQKTGAMVFEVISSESKSNVPITALMDLSNQTVEYDVVADAINQMLGVAKQYPNFRRKCICCKRKAKKAKIVCWSCTGTYGPTIEAE